MFKVEVEKECGCFRRSGMIASKEFSTQEQAVEEAKEMCEEMNNTFCGKHNFSFVQSGEDILIKMEMAN